ncbi:MAG: VirD4-like conjugal transfer protein, CD1115 family [Culicoidibacterales bacterium]
MTEKPTKPLTGWNLKDDMPNGFGGVPIASTAEKLYLSNETIHSIIIGTTGSGKTQKIIFPMIYGCGYAGESMVITDPKGEIFEETSGFLNEKGYNVRVINLRNPFQSDGWNLLDTAIRLYQEAETKKTLFEETGEALYLAEEVQLRDEAIDTLKEIAYAITHQEKSNDVQWQNFAMSLVHAIMILVMREEFHTTTDTVKNGPLRNMYSVRTILSNFVKADIKKSELHKYIATLAETDQVKDAFSTVASSSDKTLGSILTTASEATRIFGDQGIAQITKQSTFDLRDIGREKTAVYIIFPDEKKSRSVLLSLFVDSVYRELVALANSESSKSCPVRVNFILDEFGQFSQIPNLHNKLSVARSRGVRFNIAIQGFSQLKDIYGDTVSKIITENCNLLVYLLTSDLDSAKYISSLLGKQTIRNTNVNMGLENKGNFSLGNALTGRDLLMPEELMDLPQNKVVAIMKGKPFYSDVLPFWKFRNTSHFKKFDCIQLPALENVSIDPNTRLTPSFDFRTIYEEAFWEKETLNEFLVLLGNVTGKTNERDFSDLFECHQATFQRVYDGNFAEKYVGAMKETILSALKQFKESSYFSYTEDDKLLQEQEQFEKLLEQTKQKWKLTRIEYKPYINQLVYDRESKQIKAPNKSTFSRLAVSLLSQNIQFKDDEVILLQKMKREYTSHLSVSDFQKINRIELPQIKEAIQTNELVLKKSSQFTKK